MGKQQRKRKPREQRRQDKPKVQEKPKDRLDTQQQRRAIVDLVGDLDAM